MATETKKVLESLGRALGAAEAAIAAWAAKDAGKAACSALQGDKPAPQAIAALRAAEALFRVCRSRDGSAAQNALLAALAGADAERAFDPAKFGLGA